MLEDRPTDGKICCPTCGTQFAYPEPRRRAGADGGDDRDEPTRADDD